MFTRQNNAAVAAATLAAIVATVLPPSANAAVVIASTDTVLDAPIIVGANLPDPTSTTGDVRIDFVGNDLVAPAPNSRSPYDGTGFVSTAVYHSVSAGATATYSFGTTQSAFAFMWGSPDSYNTLNFFLGAANVGSFTGDAIIPPGTRGLKFVDVVFNGLFDKVVFGSIGQDAFEFTNLSSTPVPLPAAGWLLLTGLTGLGVLGRRRKPA
jgi:hypothetical protein